MNIKNALLEYIPYNEQEKKDKALMLDFIDKNPDYLLRTNETGHFTVSSWIVNNNKDKVLFCYHNIYDSWSWIGGHADGEEDLYSVALKEAWEETGVKCEKTEKNILSIEILPVFAHEKNGKFIATHLHYNITFLLFADERAEIRNKEDENSAVKWIKLCDVPKYSSEKWMVQRIYSKLIEKT